MFLPHSKFLSGYEVTVEAVKVADKGEKTQLFNESQRMKKADAFWVYKPLPDGFLNRLKFELVWQKQCL